MKNKTQISGMLSGVKNQIRDNNKSFKGGTNHNEVNRLTEIIKAENKLKLTIKIFDKVIDLIAILDKDGLINRYSYNIPIEQLKDFLIMQKARFEGNILEGDVTFYSASDIEVTNGKNFRYNICPSLIEII